MADRGDTHPDRYKVGEETIDERMKALHIAVDPADVTQSCATFVIGNESHTLGNALKWMLNKDPRVVFCGYSVPHPSDRKINVRVQTDGEHKAVDVLKDALENLLRVCDVISQKFQSTATAYREQTGQSVPAYHIESMEDAMDDGEAEAEAQESS
eukprot:m.18848 g.18848  ORF g.18848 m.18848 type:complete len:155 (+) comp7953_c1_seq2:252-716(+)